MPAFLEPNKSFDVVLDSDISKPIESRPTFFAHSQTMRRQLEILNVLDRLHEDSDATPEELFGDACRVLSETIVGWKNMGGVEFSPDVFGEILNYHEARELLRKIAYNQQVSPEQKKSSE
jgi:hypothetical protein